MEAVPLYRRFPLLPRLFPGAGNNPRLFPEIPLDNSALPGFS
jgi:hypothetical protein